MIVLKKNTSRLHKNYYIVETHYFIDPERLDSRDLSTCRAYQIQRWDNGLLNAKPGWFALYRLNMTCYEDVSWLEMLVLFNLTREDIDRIFRHLDVVDMRDK